MKLCFCGLAACGLAATAIFLSAAAFSGEPAHTHSCWFRRPKLVAAGVAVTIVHSLR